MSDFGGAIERVVNDVIESFRLAGATEEQITTVRDAVANNWDELEPTAHFAVTADAWRGHAEGQMLPEPVVARLVGLPDDDIDTVLMDKVDFDRLTEMLSEMYDDTTDELLETAGVESGVCTHCYNWIWMYDGKTWVDWSDQNVCDLSGRTHAPGPEEL